MLLAIKILTVVIWLREINTQYFLGFWYVTLEEVFFQPALLY